MKENEREGQDSPHPVTRTRINLERAAVQLLGSLPKIERPGGRGHTWNVLRAAVDWPFPLHQASAVLFLF